MLGFQLEKCDRPIVHAYWSKAFSKADVEDTAFTFRCEENCKSPEPSLVGKPATLLNSPGGARSIRHCNCQCGSNSLIRERPRNFKLPDKWRALSLPDPSAARAVYCLRRVFLFQKFLTNRTGSLPHIRTWLSTCRQAGKRLVVRGSPVCFFLHTLLLNRCVLPPRCPGTCWQSHK